MSYQVIARKWRPQNFEQLVGQDHITTTLRNSLRTGRLHHALLFTGPRGTGKTSSARILAKSIRCPNAVDFVPCNNCPSCNDISIGRSIDVIEIDGASNNGVESVRELRDTVVFMPSTGRFKIYIIDEVHMLSTAAFNALLKTLEEPPDHVIFVFATTEVQKIPATILSRCQRFDFRRISTRTIAERLQLICKTDNVKYTEDALWMIARQGDGSMRDSQSLLDQVITFAGPDLQLETVTTILGLTDHQLIKDSLSAIVHRDPSALGPCLLRMSKMAIDPNLFLGQLISDLRHLSMVKIFNEEAAALIDLPDSDLRVLKDFSVLVTEADLQILFDMALKGAQDVNRASEPQWALEMTLLRLASAPRWADFPRLYEALESGTALAVASAPTVTSSSSTPELKGPVQRLSEQTTAAKAPVQNFAPKATPVASAPMNPQDRWFEFVQKIKRTDSLLGAQLEPMFFLKADGGRLELASPTNKTFLRDQLMEAGTREKIEALLQQHWGTSFIFDVKVVKDTKDLQAANSHATSSGASAGHSSNSAVPSVSAATPLSAKTHAQQKAKAAESEMLELAEKNPKVASFNRVFQGKVQGFASKPPNTKE